MFSRAVLLVLIVVLTFSPDLWALSGTKGTPLGGMGTGYVVFNGATGDFAASGKNPPAGADQYASNKDEFGTGKSSSSGFHFFANNASEPKAKAATAADEDAKCPLYTVNFGETGKVKFTLNAFGPYLPGDNPDNFKLATSPMAFFEITAVNNNTAAVDVAAALEFSNGTLLGGAASGTVETGNQAISFAGTSDNAYLTVDCDGTSPTYSAGAIGTFATAGTLANAAGNLVAAKCNVAAAGTVHFKFILSWYRGYGSENYWYNNNYANSKEVAAFGKLKFDAVRNGVTSFVARTLASNFPDWYKDRLLNNTYPMIHNSQCAKDGRIAFWEGKYGIIGTIDQGEHASLFYTFNWPEVQWHELQYWKRSAHKTPAGQIHHDVNTGIEKFAAGSDSKRFMCSWDDSERDDYWWFKNTTTWADLNMMFIFKAYELMLATGNVDSMKAYLPAIKTTAQRIVSQCASGSALPLECHSTYDESTDGGKTFNTSPEYNGGVVLPAYLAVAEIAKFCGDDATAATYRQKFEAGRTEYKTKFANAATYATGKDCSEGDVAGYSWANYLGFEPVMDSGFIMGATKKLMAYYQNRTESGVDALRAKLGKWGFYTCDHWGGAEIATGNADNAMKIHDWDWQYYYKGAPAMVFWQNLRKESEERAKYASYMTGPTVWRSYFQMMGYLIDNANNRLFIKPNLPTVMNKKITKALLLNPKCLGTLDYDETVSGDRVQTIHVAYDAPVTIKELVLKNNTTVAQPGVSIKQNNVSAAATAAVEGTGLGKIIRVKMTAPIQIGPEGIDIAVYNGAVPIGKGIGCSYTRQFALSFASSRISAASPVRYCVDVAGPVSMELIGVNGAKVGVIMNKSIASGNHVFQWNGATLDGRLVAAGMTLLRITSKGGSLTKPVFVGK